jgi:hypothetical protein
LKISQLEKKRAKQNEKRFYFLILILSQIKDLFDGIQKITVIVFLNSIQFLILLAISLDFVGKKEWFN